MSFESGDRLGPYEIRGKIGEGGMGAVYRAVDARLGREVAIKVLPAEFVGDAERRARFEREAKLLAALNHPNVAQLYGVEEGPAGTLALVLELVEGTNLDTRLAAGALAIDEAVAIAGEIAAALADAHDKGIVHRDLKPQNVRITPSGAVKVLDFGLAKALDPATTAVPDTPTLMNSPTLTGGATELGVILGTAAYMSPEQARGRPIDRRADVWAFGCVLYEMLTGERLFAGETATDTLAAVLRRDIPWTRLPADLPHTVRLLLRRCLERDPKQRLRDLGDAALLLREPDETRAIAGSMRARRPLVMATAALAAAALGLGAGWVIFGRGGRSSDGPARTALLAVRLPTGIAAAIETTAQTQVLAISRDAKRIAFVGNQAGQQRIYLRRLDEKEVRTLPGSENGTSPFFSPDGNWLAFFARGKLRKAAIAGGEPVELCDVGRDRGGLWLADGTIVFSPGTARGLSRVSAAGGQPVELTRLDEARGERSHRWPALLPGGKEVAFTVGLTSKPGDYEDAEIHAVDLETGKRRRLYQGASLIRFTRSGHALLGHEGELQALAWDGAPGSLPGEPVKVLLDVRGEPASGVVYFDVADDGTLVYAERGPGGNERSLAWVDRAGTPTPIAAPLREYRVPRISPDGKRIAVGIGRGRGGTSDIWIVDVASGTLSRLTFEGRSEVPVWSRDGQAVIYRTGTQRHANLLAEKRADGSAEARIIAELDPLRARGPLDHAADGTLLFSEDYGAGFGNDIMKLLPGQPAPLPVAQTGPSESNGALSPDGRLVAYSVSVSGGAEYMVQTFPALTGRWQVGQGHGTLRWAPSGKALYIRSPSAMLEVPIDLGPPFRSGTPRELFPFPYLDSEDVYTNWDVAPDGRFLVVSSLADPALSDRLIVALDWFETLERLAPTSTAAGQRGR